MTALLILILALSWVAAPRSAPDPSVVSVAATDDATEDAAQGRTGAPMTLVVPVLTTPASSAGTGVGVRDGGAPTPGIASWYDDGPGLYAAAGPALRVGAWRGSVVEVCAKRCVRVRLTDWCQCYKGTKRERVIDLSPEAFARLAPLRQGLVRVTVAPWRVPRGLLEE